MIEWAEWNDTEAATGWNAAVVQLANHTYYQAYGWGEFKRRERWIPRRATILVNGRAAAMVQCLVREIRVARTAIVWVPGGPAGSDALGVLGDALRQRYRSWLLSVRINGAFEVTARDEETLERAGWTRARVRLGQSFTFHVDLTCDASQRRAALSQNWRHNLTRGEQRGGRVEAWAPDADLDPVYRVYSETADRKGVRRSFDLDDLRALRAIFGPAFTLAAAVDEAGTPAAIRAFMRLGARADDFVSGVSDDGRRRYSNYLLTWRLLQMAADQGAATYDLAGADPVDGAGVYGFKRGLGGRGVQLLGEWEWHNNRCLAWAVDRTIGRRAASALPA